MVNMAELGEWLDLVILEGLFNLNNSIIPCLEEVSWCLGMARNYMWTPL